MRCLLKWVGFTVLAGLFSSCDAHDYWSLPEAIEVNSEAGILTASNTESLSQDLFVRYQFDYQVHNLSSQPTEVVVSATSYVNTIERISGQKVWHLEADEMGEGILTTSQLQLGNMLVVNLSCCSESRCARKDVLCPSSDTALDASEIANFCYASCQDTTACLVQCPSEAACQYHCDNVSEEDCRANHCDYGGDIASCAHYCVNDAECYSNCEPTQECQETCISQRATCYRNCVATGMQCAGIVFNPQLGDESFSSEERQSSDIPCALCGGEGACRPNFERTEVETDVLTSLDGVTYHCEMDCSRYPVACVTGCESLFADESSRLLCMDTCLQQHLFWCNDDSIPYDYVDSRGTQPCCFEGFCHNSMIGVVKSYNVECFNDTSCSSGKYCSDEGVCVAYGDSSCQSHVRSSSTLHFWWIFALCGGMFWCFRRRLTSLHEL